MASVPLCKKKMEREEEYILLTTIQRETERLEIDDEDNSETKRFFSRGDNNNQPLIFFEDNWKEGRKIETALVLRGKEVRENNMKMTNKKRQ